MDPLSLATLSTAVGVVLSGAATQVGKQSVEGLLGFVKRVRIPGRRELASQIESHPEVVDADHVASVLYAEAEQNPEYAAQLQQWVREQTNLSGGVVFNNGPVDGNVTQIGNISGSTTFNIS
ncbi:hypothetical protein [Mycobacteroides abscessus]|uniref:hypothetical protein n=2 Tax=Mycobacteroides abscessus TaxID=36809 RepID=UPI0011C4AC7E|nr:hypothetical protein [Mycobacteroides abscessus]